MTINNPVKPQLANYTSRPPYATIRHLRGVLRPSVLEEHDDDTLAIDVLDAPLEVVTTAPHWILDYLHQHKETDIEERDLYREAYTQGYRKSTIYRALKEYVSNEPNVGMWWDSRERKAYIRWYDMEQEEYDQRRKLLEEF